MKTLLRIALAFALVLSATAKEIRLLNVSYDPNREAVHGGFRTFFTIANSNRG